MLNNLRLHSTDTFNYKKKALRIRWYSSIIALIAFCAISVPAVIQATPPNLIINNQMVDDESSPLGISNKSPQFSWHVDGLENLEFQVAYQLQVASSIALLEADTPDLWNSSRILSDRSFSIRYSGKKLTSRMQ